MLEESNQERLLKMLKAISNPIRFTMMNKMASGQACTTHQLVQDTGLAQSTVSQHIKVLKEAGLINGVGKGASTCYRVEHNKVIWLQKYMDLWANQCCPKSENDCLQADEP